MRGVRSIYHHFITLCFFVVLVVLILFSCAFSIHANTLSSTESLTISRNLTIVSPGKIFELGFFKPSTRPRWYLGIWYKKIPERTYVWVANRDTPLSNSVGTLKISDGNLVILDHSNIPIWSTNTKGDVRSPIVAELLDTGNLVIRYFNNNSQEFLWQSFDFPTDTLLPEMKLGWDRKTGLNRFLRSYKSSNDPTSGSFSYKLETGVYSEFFMLAKNSPVYRTGPWNGIQFIGMPEMRKSDYVIYNFTENNEEVSFTFLMTSQNTYSRLKLSDKGEFERFTWIPTSSQWSLSWSSPKDQCDVYDLCGPYSYCDINTSPICHCIQGFEPKFPEWKLIDAAGGCVRRTPLNCGKDRFLPLKQMKLPDTKTVIVDRKIGMKDCKKRCLNDCNCTAYANTDIGGTGCVMWIGELLDIRNYAVGSQDLYVRLAASELGKEKNINGKIIGLIVGVSVVLFLSFITFCFWKWKQKQARASAAPNVNPERSPDILMDGMVIPSDIHLSTENITDDLLLPSTDFEVIVRATNNFSVSNKLGEGGFGIVYKGRLHNGKEFAVKRLSDLSHQGSDEFKTEVKVISRLQHINLVRILGCCASGKEKMLIYEYLENSSLDRHLFDKTRSSNLNWQRRFDITNGIARGILYLHHDSRCRIIHRDLKASNILLDKNMIPKISDFGMARIFSDDVNEAITRRIVGTYGYMSPEYAMDGIYSEKSDVFSFGVMLLEIVTGMKNRGFFNSDLDSNLLSYVWRNMEEEKGLAVADPNIIDSSSLSPTFRPDEVLRCIKIALLCVQEYAEDRPTMLSVVSMLGSETAEIPKAKAPGYCVGRSLHDTNSSSSLTWTFGFAFSEIEPR
uniref:Receptor-like serine/threonine-protein kinase n=1 Tax=Arabidopsis halleri subsp. gemmifera TaxID=63677 RepID=I7FWN4_ARAHG|nr:SRK [Arabidopsis halleri subsp. gemmifera]